MPFFSFEKQNIHVNNHSPSIPKGKFFCCRKIEAGKNIVNSYYLIYEDNDENTMSYSERISDIYTWCGLDLSKSPSELAWFAMLIPILSFLTQWISMKITTSNQPNMADNPMGSSLKVMNFTMPLISAFFCYTLPTGLGLYWVIGSVFQIGKQFTVGGDKFGTGNHIRSPPAPSWLR